MEKQNKPTNAALDLEPEALAQNGSGVAEQPDFETALTQLEALVGQMERGDLPLEQSIKAYAKGVELISICQKSLDVAEQQVQVLQDNLLRSLNEDALGSED